MYSSTQLLQDNEYKICCPIHNQPGNFCLNQYCKDERILCFSCLNDGKHSHKSDFCNFHKLLDLIEERQVKIQSIFEQLDHIKEQTLQFENKLKQKYNISKEEVSLMQNDQLCTFIDHIIKNEKEFNDLLTSLKNNFNYINETVSYNSQTLELDLNQYSWNNLKQKQISLQQNSTKIFEDSSSICSNNFQSNLIPIIGKSEMNQQSNRAQNLKTNPLISKEEKQSNTVSGGDRGFTLDIMKWQIDSFNQFIKVVQNQYYHSKQEQMELQKNCYKYPIALFLGQPGVGKTSLIKTLFQGYINKLKEFQLYTSRIDDSLIYNFVDTKGFDFESSIDEREEQIQLYQSIFYKYPNKVGSLFVVVNFGNVDQMKKKILSIYKFFRKFSTIISIIVTEMQLSDDQNQIEDGLKKHFSFFKSQNIIFVRRDIQRDELLSKLNENSLNKIKDDYKFDVTDTIFEKEDEEEIKRLQSQLMQRFK